MNPDTLIVPPPPNEPYVRVVPLGGCGEIGRNMTVIETNDDLVVVDCGLMFPDEEMFGVDIVINDFTYLRERAHKFRALLVTHGHEDHIGGIPYLLREFDVPIVGTPLSLALIQPVKGAVVAMQWHLGMHGFAAARQRTHSAQSVILPN